MIYRCFIFPWHHVRGERALSEWSDLLACSCGRRFVINYESRAVLPYDRDVEKFYERRGKGAARPCR